MKHSGRILLTVFLLFSVLFYSATLKAKTNISELPRDELGRYILPPVLPEQREQGKKLLKKIMDQVLYEPMTDGEKIFEKLGFEVAIKNAYSDHEYFLTNVPKKLNKDEFKGIDILSYLKNFNESKQTNKINHKLSVLFKFYYDKSAPCIHIDDANFQFKRLARRTSSGPLISTGTFSFAPQQSIDYISFQGLNNSLAGDLSVSFDYSKLFCAGIMTIDYVSNLRD